MVIYAYQGAGMPPRQEFWCQYAQAWAAVKRCVGTAEHLGGETGPAGDAGDLLKEPGWGRGR
jgi:hypothetical protein